MAKMLRARKHFGRCSVKGHGQGKCVVNEEIQSKPITRAKEKQEFTTRDQLHEIINASNLEPYKGIHY